MHYDSYGNGVFRNPAMVKLDGSIIEPNKKMSELDIVTLNKMYPCDNSCDQTNVQGKIFFSLDPNPTFLNESLFLPFIKMFKIHSQTMTCYPNSAISKRKFKFVVKM